MANKKFLQALSGQHKIFLDTMCFIYHTANHPDYSPLTESLFHHIQTGSIAGYTSQISVIECFSLPEKKQDQLVITAYENLFQQFPNLSIVPLGWEVARTASKLRSKYTNLRTPDAIQIATALWHEADLFLTNDQKLRQITELPVLILADFC